MKSVLILASLSLLSAQEFRVGGRVAEFTVNDLQGQAISSSALTGKVTVVVFLSTQCPVSNAYNERMEALFREFGDRVKFVFLNANSNESASDIAAHSRASGFSFPVYKDVNNVVADRFGAQSTPESYVLDAAGVMRYHGYIDDAQNLARIKNQGLKLAIGAVLEGREVATAETKAFGCTIKRTRRTSR